MQVFDVKATIDEINFAPKTEYEEISQNVKTILTTVKYSVPLDRSFGINASLIDAPIEFSQAKLTAEIINAIQKYEPRVKVQRVIYSGDIAEGKLKPTVRVVIK